ncbi:septum site-determining protein MinC [Aliidiomarina minuta]|uniref:Probable septum site-determining protein MinC n=1 Tax=Aliidiomarina minuta TaxID=880057 RepID=A0A432W5Z9_9GAMM|nr:septum site-determining protein MinC [Aliidiomarina minuta]RUO25498.1 septum site-determining protein MinC [Aliidiomarina minuta]
MSNAPVLKGSSFTFSILQLFDNNVEQAIEYLQAKISQAPAFFAQAPLIINIEQVTEQQVPFEQLKAGIETLGMRPVAVVGCETESSRQAVFNSGMAALRSAGNHSEINIPQESEQNTKGKTTQVVKVPVRSGQQVYAQGCDLVVLGPVSNGAEVIADGSIQIYGTLRGRAIAGASGQLGAHIICQNLQAELISIAGDYWLSEQIESEYWKQSVMISKVNDSLQIESIKI